MEFRNGDLYTGEWDGAKGNGVISYTDESKYEVGIFSHFIRFLLACHCRYLRAITFNYTQFLDNFGQQLQVNIPQFRRIFVYLPRTF